MSRTLDVFGVSNNIIESYVERNQVDGFFHTALELNKQIVVYGSSKQGKTSLIKKHLEPNSTIPIQCSPAMALIDIYSSILRQCNIPIQTDSSEESTRLVEGGGSLKAKVKIPLFLEVEGEGSGKGATETKHVKEYKSVEFNLGLAQDIAEILKSINFQKHVILDNFHYLPEEIQKAFAFDLRIFQDLDIRFIILGIWRERNRLTQFNGDLQDRIVEVAVEPWDHGDLKSVIQKGSAILNVDFSDIVTSLIESSFDSIGVLQELCKESCLAANVSETVASKQKITNDNLREAIRKKLDDYAGRHLRAFETFADSPRKMRGGLIPLFIPYYFLKVLLNSNFTDVINGFKRKDLQQKIISIHHRPDDVRASDMSNFLYPIINYQISKDINPPLFDFDRSINTLKIIDSTLYFFLRNCNREEVLESIQPPSEELAKRESETSVGSTSTSSGST
ncbi:MAG: hypothetical protein ACYDAJ_04060 [Nitrosotalea sp.]